jgi:acyl-CoA thioesterase-2
VDARTFFDLHATDDPKRWHMTVVPHLCSGIGALFGGAGLGVAVEAMEVCTGRPLAWATAQYLSFARPPAELEIQVVEAAVGRHVTQARAVARVGSQEILTANAALGRGPAEWAGMWAEMPTVPPPEDCPPRTLLPQHEGSIMSRIDMRLADARDLSSLPGPPGSGRCAVWVSVTDLEMSAAYLAIVGDYIPFGISQALGVLAGGRSLDNTVRVVSREETDWVLCDIRMHAVAHGFGHGTLHLWSRQGTLLGTASQTAAIREWLAKPASGGGSLDR